MIFAIVLAEILRFLPFEAHSAPETRLFDKNFQKSVFFHFRLEILDFIPFPLPNLKFLFAEPSQLGLLRLQQRSDDDGAGAHSSRYAPLASSLVATGRWKWGTERHQ